MTNNHKSRTIELTMLQRLGLEGLMGEQRGKREENRAFYQIRQKVKLPPEERRRYITQLPNGNAMTDEVALANAPATEITFTDDEVRRLIKLGDTIEMPVGLLDWFEPLLQALESPVDHPLNT